MHFFDGYWHFAHLFIISLNLGDKNEFVLMVVRGFFYMLLRVSVFFCLFILL